MPGQVESRVIFLEFRVTQKSAAKCGDFLAYNWKWQVAEGKEISLLRSTGLPPS